MRLTIGTQMRLLVTMVAMGFGLCVLVTFRLLAARQADGAIRADGEAVQSALRTTIRDRGGLQAKLTGYLATSPRVTMLTEGDAVSAQDVIGELRETAGVDGMLLFNADRKRLGAAGFKDPKSAEAAAKELIDKAFEGQSGHTIAEADGDPMLIAVAPFRIGEYVKGAIATFLRMDATMARTTGESVRGDVAFVHQGRILGASLPVGGLRLQEGKAVQTLTIRGVPYVAQYATMPETPEEDRLGVVTLQSVDDATATYRQLTSAFVVVLAAVTAVSLLGGAALTQTLTRPLDRVVRAAQVLQKGEWPAPFNTRRKDEVGLLQQVFDDMTASMQADQARLLAMLDRDPLTELENHRSFKQRLDQEASRAAASDGALSLVLIDLDRFGAYNDDHGHAAGDRLLVSVAQAVRAAAPEFAHAARHGADTFAILMPQVGPDVLDGLMEGFAQAVRGCGATAAVGGAAFHRDAQESGGLALAAGLAVGRAQRLGGDQAVGFDTVGEEGADPYEVSRLVQDASLATIQALAAAVDAKDPYTKGHSLRVAEMSRDLCAWMGGTPEEVDRIYRSGTLHDVGKIGVPDAILKKPARLEEDERRTMEAHPVLGEIIVRKVPQLEDLLPGVRHHHETYDGRGYPDGLAGDRIPRMARLMAVADTYDAMTSDRPYRKGLPIEVALAEITKGAGTQFDPAMAQAFCEMIRARVEAEATLDEKIAA